MSRSEMNDMARIVIIEPRSGCVVQAAAVEVGARGRNFDRSTTIGGFTWNGERNCAAYRQPLSRLKLEPYAMRPRKLETQRRRLAWPHDALEFDGRHSTIRMSGCENHACRGIPYE